VAAKWQIKGEIQCIAELLFCSIWDAAEDFHAYIALRKKDFEAIMSSMFIKESFDVEISPMTDH